VLLLHGTGASKAVFAHQFSSSLATRFRLIAIDFLGHGNSSDADDPQAAYSIGGFAETVFEVLDALHLARTTVLGWSLGGHVAIEMLRQRPLAVAGLMLTGAPPSGSGPLAMLRAFRMRPEMLFTSKPVFSLSESERFAQLCYGAQTTTALINDIVRSDGRARPVIYRSLPARVVPDQRRLVEQTPIPVAIVNGADDPIVRLSYVETLVCRQLWTHACHVIEGAGHAPFLQRPERFNALLARFAEHVANVAMLEPVRAEAV
jgi:pimeloyl-ACP methyl ester carboxylesterase